MTVDSRRETSELIPGHQLVGEVGRILARIGDEDRVQGIMKMLSARFEKMPQRALNRSLANWLFAELA